MIEAVEDDNPVIFVEHRLLYGTKAEVPEEVYRVPFGKAKVVCEGNDVTIVGISNMVVECLRANKILEGVGISSEIIDPVSLMPLDLKTIAASVKKTGHLIVVDNGWTACGASAEIVASVSELLGDRLIKTTRLGYQPTTCPTSPVLEKVFYPNPVTIAEKTFSMVKPGSPEWHPSPELAELAYQTEFKGPF